MNTMLAYCGLTCDSCPIHLATLESDPAKKQSMRISIAKMCTEHYGMPMQPAEVNDCDGCRAGARLFSGCTKCEIRICAAERKVESCAFCPSFKCDKLRHHFEIDPTAESRLMELRTKAVKGN